MRCGGQDGIREQKMGVREKPAKPQTRMEFVY